MSDSRLQIQRQLRKAERKAKKAKQDVQRMFRRREEQQSPAGGLFGFLGSSDEATQQLLTKLIAGAVASFIESSPQQKNIQVQAFIENLRRRLGQGDDEVQDAMVGLFEAFDRFAHVMDLGKPTSESRKVMAQAACAIADELDKKSRFEDAP